MCLAKPLKLIELNSSNGLVDMGGGTLEVGLDLVPDAKIGDFVLVHAGMAIELLAEDDAASILEAYEDYVVIDAPLAAGEHDES